MTAFTQQVNVLLPRVAEYPKQNNSLLFKVVLISFNSEALLDFLLKNANYLG